MPGTYGRLKRFHGQHNCATSARGKAPNRLNFYTLVSVTLDEVIKAIENDPRCVIYPLDSHVIHAMPIIADIHDGIICGTALLYRDLLGESVKILMRDGQIRKLSNIITIW